MSKLCDIVNCIVYVTVCSNHDGMFWFLVCLWCFLHSNFHLARRFIKQIRKYNCKYLLKHDIQSL